MLATVDFLCEVVRNVRCVATIRLRFQVRRRRAWMPVRHRDTEYRNNCFHLQSKNVTSRNQSPGPLQRVAIESKAVEHLHLLLILLRLFTREFLSGVSFVHIVLREDGEIPPVSAALFRLHFLDNAGV